MGPNATNVCGLRLLVYAALKEVPLGIPQLVYEDFSYCVRGLKLQEVLATGV
jgi:hypothetical protein